MVGQRTDASDFGGLRQRNAKFLDSFFYALNPANGSLEASAVGATLVFSVMFSCVSNRCSFRAQLDREALALYQRPLVGHRITDGTGIWQAHTLQLPVPVGYWKVYLVLQAEQSSVQVDAQAGELVN